MRIGIHCSTAGSLERAALKAHELKANAFQIFSASPRMWRAKAPDPAQVKRLKDCRERYDLAPLVIHDSYLINLASPPSIIREKSIDGFRGELERALIIGADYLVTHPGSYRGQTLEQALSRAAEALALAWRGVDCNLKKGARLSVLLENTAGAGAQLGSKLGELAFIRQLAGPYLNIPVGFCLDTCHCYVSGFDLAVSNGLDELVRQAEDTIGLINVPVIHANDAKTPLNSHSDRHANIGEGYIGRSGFRRILTHAKLREKAFILETPVDNPGDDARNVRALWDLASTELGGTRRGRPLKSRPHPSRRGY